MEQTIDIKSFIVLLLRRWYVIVLGTIIGFAIAFTYSNWFVTPMYSSSSKLFVSNSAESVFTDKTSYTYNELTTSRELAGAYIVILNDTTVKNVAEDFAANWKKADNTTYSKAELASYIKLAQIGETELVQVTVTSPNPELSKAMCEQVLISAPDALDKIVKSGFAEPVGVPVANYNPVSPQVTRNSIIGFLIGFVLSCAVLLLIEIYDNRINDEATFTRKFNIPVLGKIPSLDNISKGANDAKYGSK